MITRMILSAAVFSFSLIAQAETKRYMVTFKDAQAFQHVAQAYRGTTTMNVVGSAMKVEVLEKVQVLVVEGNSNAIASFESNPQVARIEEEVFHPAPPTIATKLNSAPMSMSAAQEVPWGINAVKAPQAWNTTRGAGVKVAVVDTGLDVRHPAVASRVSAVRNFTPNTPGNVDPADVTDLAGHGTHVAGTVLADGANGGLVGVAPEANLYAARVCGTMGCSSIAITQGVNWAVEQGVDVINMSLGGGFMTFAEKAAYDRAEQLGVMIVAASGNDGQQRVSFPAAYTTILAVGATDINNHKADFSNWGPELDVVGPGVDVRSSVPLGTGRVSEVAVDFGSGPETLVSTSFQGSPARKVEGLGMVFTGLGKPEDFVGKDVTGKIALIQRGEINFAVKVQNAIQAGAGAVMIFNNAPGLIQGGLTDDGSEVAIPVVMIEQASGLRAKDLLDQGTLVSSTMGVVPTDYASFQGTSMASPHVAGVAALVKGANPNLTPAQIRQILMQTATALTPNGNNEFGAGLVNAEAAVAQARIGVVLGLASGF